MFAKLLTLVLLCCLAACCAARDACSESNNQYKGQNLTTSIIPVAVHQVNNSNIKIIASGTLHVINECQFLLSNFTILNIPAFTYWYAVSGDVNSSSAFKLSETQVIAYNGGNVTYNLTTEPGREVNWNMVSAVKIYNEQQRLLVAYAVLKNSSSNGNGDGDSNSSNKQSVTVFCLSLTVLLLFMM